MKQDEKCAEVFADSVIDRDADYNADAWSLTMLVRAFVGFLPSHKMIIEHILFIDRTRKSTTEECEKQQKTKNK